eukprot:CFRG5070T1
MKNYNHNGHRILNNNQDGLRMKYELYEYNPVAKSSAMVVSSDGRVRFTLLTDSMVRIEQGKKVNTSKGYTFEDRPSIGVVNRNLDVPEYTTKDDGDIMEINTEKWILQYRVGADINDKTGRSIVVIGKAGEDFKFWNSSMRSKDDVGNLLGTFRTLDRLDRITLNCTINKQDHCEWGIISRSGWAVIDDSDGPVMDTNDWWTNEQGDLYERNNDVDLYLFLHGLDYKRAITDYTKVFGSIPLLPRYTLGTWFTRWFDYNDHGVRRVVNQFRDVGIPLDIFVFDMNWHKKNSWTGYSWDTNLFPHPVRTLEWLKSQKLHTSANLHDAEGVQKYEDEFKAACLAIGVDPSTTEVINFTVADSNVMLNGLEDVVLSRLEQQGIDFWWIDWQQGESGFGAYGGKMNPTIWTNKIRATDAKRRGNSRKRGFVLARWGGHGTHRYQVGFSGDVKTVNWANLAYQPYFTMTGSNLGYGWWSHDITGPSNDHELYTRWIQWGAWSGIMRLHERGRSAGTCADPFPAKSSTGGYSACGTIHPWKVPDKYFEANKAAILERTRLIPYIYTQSRISFETGVSIIQPLYYYYPRHAHAYAADETGNFPQFFFGEDIMISPVVVKSSSAATSEVLTWLPPGRWYSINDGMLRDGKTDGLILSQKLALQEYGVYVKAGAVLPRIAIKPGDTFGLAQRPYTTLVYSLYPGANKGENRVYEDDGISMSYLRGDFAWITASYERTSNGKKLVFIVTVDGYYEGMVRTRHVHLRVVGLLLPTNVYVNGSIAPLKRHDNEGQEKETVGPTWHFDGDNDLAVVIIAKQWDISIPLVIELNYDALDIGISMNGFWGAIKRANLVKDVLDEERTTPGSTTVMSTNLIQLSSTGMNLEYHAMESNIDRFYDIVNGVKDLTNRAKKEVSEIHGTDSNRKQFCVDIMNEIFL